MPVVAAFTRAAEAVSTAVLPVDTTAVGTSGAEIQVAVTVRATPPVPRDPSTEAATDPPVAAYLRQEMVQRLPDVIPRQKLIRIIPAL